VSINAIENGVDDTKVDKPNATLANSRFWSDNRCPLTTMMIGIKATTVTIN
jgi:hypothetical protein